MPTNAGAVLLALVVAGGSWTATTGEAGAQHIDVTTDSPYHAVRGLKLWSYDQRVCRIDLAVAGLGSAGPTSVEGPKACEPQMSESWKGVDVGDGNLLVAIQACTDPERHQLAGLRVWGAHPSQDGTLGKPGAPAEVVLPGCKTWHAKVSCEHATVATGVRAVYDSAKHGISGLALHCNALARAKQARAQKISPAVK